MKFVKVWPININIRINKSILNEWNEGEIGQPWITEVFADVLSLFLLLLSTYSYLDHFPWIHIARWNQ